LLVVLASFAAPAGAAEPVQPVQSVRIVILPVVVHRAPSDSGYVSRGIADMLSARLEQIEDIAVVSVENPKAATTDAHAARKTASAVDGDYVIFGAFTQFGEGASLDIQCVAIDPANEHEVPRRVFIQSGAVGEIIPNLDVLVAKLVAHLRAGGEISEASAIAAAESSNGQDPNAMAGGGDDIQELRERVEALEQAVYDAELVAEEAAVAAEETALVVEETALVAEEAQATVQEAETTAEAAAITADEASAAAVVDVEEEALPES